MTFSLNKDTYRIIYYKHSSIGNDIYEVQKRSIQTHKQWFSKDIEIEHWRHICLINDITLLQQLEYLDDKSELREMPVIKLYKRGMLGPLLPLIKMHVKQIIRTRSTSIAFTLDGEQDD